MNTASPVFRAHPGSIGATGRWQVLEVDGTAAEFHDLPFPDEAQPTIWVFRPTADALVLGSGQRTIEAEVTERLAPGLAVCRRRSGGGAVLVDGSMLWIDVLIPAGDAAFDADLGKTFVRVGTAWQQAFAAAGVVTDRWDQRAERLALADQVCFAGRGWGELTVHDGAGGWIKVLGLSQRRTRWGARVQCLATFTPQVKLVSALLNGEPAPSERPRAGGDPAPADLEAEALRWLTAG